MLDRLTHDFDSLSGQQKKARLVQMAELGPSAIAQLTKSMADPDLEVARAAYQLLQRSQNEWTVLEEATRIERHRLLVQSIAENAFRLPEDRIGWGTSLIQQTVMEVVEQNSDPSRQLFREANHAIELLSISGPPAIKDQSIDVTTMDDHANDLGHPKRLAVRAQPLPVDQSTVSETWTRWPPPLEPTSNHDPQDGDMVERTMATKPVNVLREPTESPSVYRSGSRLRPVMPSETIVLNSIHAEDHMIIPEPDPAPESAPTSIQPVVHLVASPMQTYDDQSVIHWLGSEHEALREKAKAELTRRGYGQSELSIATQIAHGDTATRLALVDSISESASLDPRPWLLMLLEDPNRDVRLRVISVLATLDDPQIDQRLRLHLLDENDPTVASRIRRVLKLR